MRTAEMVASQPGPTAASLRSAGWILGLTLVALGCAPPPEPPRPPARIGILGFPAELDPHRQNDSISYSVLFNVYEGLTRFDADMAIRPGLAETWETVDDLTWRFVLRAANFHDGRRLTAADVVYSLERARNDAESRTSGYLVAVESVREVGEREIEIRTRAPTAILLNKLAFVAIVPEGWDGVTPLGTGPYRLEPQSGAIRLTAFESHWGGPLEIGEVDLVVVPEAADRLQGLLDGSLDATIGLSPTDAARVEVQAELVVERRPRLSVAYLGMDVTAPPFDDLRVRRALHLAIDRRALLDALDRTQGRPATQLVSQDVFGFAADLELPATDREAARRLLAEAGYPEGLEVELGLREGLDLQPLVDQLAQVGVRARVVHRPWRELLEGLAQGATDFYLGGFLCPSGDASDLLDNLVHTREPDRGYGGDNFSGYANPELDRLIEESRGVLNMLDRRQRLERAQDLVMEDLPYLPLYVPDNLVARHRELVWHPRLDGFVRVREMAWAPP